MTSDFQLTFDCADPARLAAFWCATLGYRLEPPPAGFDSWEGALAAWGVPEEDWNSRAAIVALQGEHPRLFFQRVPEGKVVKNRLHLDVRAAPGLSGDERMAALETEADRLAELGAARDHRVDPAPTEAGFIVMHDPEGNEFCLD